MSFSRTGSAQPGEWKTDARLWRRLKPLARQMRHEPTPAEDCLWQRLRGRRLNGLRFRRQHSIERFVVDFYCAEARLIIEVDGPVHQYIADEDATRQEFLESLGLTVIRVTNDDVMYSLEAVLDRLEQLTAALGAHNRNRGETTVAGE